LLRCRSWSVGGKKERGSDQKIETDLTRNPEKEGLRKLRGYNNFREQKYLRPKSNEEAV